MFYPHVEVELNLLPFWCLENKICITTGRGVGVGGQEWGEVKSKNGGGRGTKTRFTGSIIMGPSYIKI